MHKRAFIKVAAAKAGMTQVEFEKLYDAMLETITENVAEGHKVQLTSFGTFKASKRKARKGRNPATGEAMTIPARTVAVFSAGAALKRVIAAAFDEPAKQKPKAKKASKPAKKSKGRSAKKALTREIEPAGLSAAQFKTFAK